MTDLPLFKNLLDGYELLEHWGLTALVRPFAAFMVFLLFVATRRWFSAIVIERMCHLTGKTKTQIDDAVLEALKNPLGLIPIVLGLFFAFECLGLTGQMAFIAGLVLKTLIVFILFWGLINIVRALSFLFKRLEQLLSSSFVDWLVKALNAALGLIGVATILEIWGIRIGPIIAGLGLFGVAVALGAQDLFKNLISGILILAERRFALGDWIAVDGVVEGTVVSIGFRSTLIRRFDMAPVHVPNSLLSDHAVTNFSKMAYRRIYWMIGVEYQTSIAQLQIIRDKIEAYLRGKKDFVKPPDAQLFVRIDRFSPSAIDIMLYCFTKSIVWGEWLAVKEALAYQIKEIVEQAGACFALPSHSVYVHKLPSERPEAFVPPTDLPQGRAENIHKS